MCASVYSVFLSHSPNTIHTHSLLTPHSSSFSSWLRVRSLCQYSLALSPSLPPLFHLSSLPLTHSFFISTSSLFSPSSQIVFKSSLDYFYLVTRRVCDVPLGACSPLWRNLSALAEETAAPLLVIRLLWYWNHWHLKVKLDPVQLVVAGQVVSITRRGP